MVSFLTKILSFSTYKICKFNLFLKVQPDITVWQSLGGLFSGDPGACSWGENRLDVFVRGLDGATYHKAGYGLEVY
jgi:hypothetical protein